MQALNFNLQRLSVFAFYQTENIEEVSKRLLGGDILSFVLILSLKVLKLTDLFNNHVNRIAHFLHIYPSFVINYLNDA